MNCMQVSFPKLKSMYVVNVRDDFKFNSGYQPEILENNFKLYQLAFVSFFIFTFQWTYKIGKRR